MTTPPHSAVNAPRQQSGASAFVVGGGRVGQHVANRLTEVGEPVTFVDLANSTEQPSTQPHSTQSHSTQPHSTDPHPIEAPSTGPSATQAVELVDSIDGTALDSVGFDDATAVLALAPRDATNLLVARLARSRFDVERILVRVNDPDRTPAFDDIDVETVDVESVLADAIVAQW